MILTTILPHRFIIFTGVARVRDIRLRRRPLNSREPIMKKRSSMSTELELRTPEKKREQSSRRLDLATGPSSGDSDFTLPRDWLVNERTRATGTGKGATYKHYHEPGTGRVFRSLASVKRYLLGTGHETMTRDDIKLEMPPQNVSPLSVAVPGVDSSLKYHSKPSSKRLTTLEKALSVKSANQIVVYRRSYIPKDLLKIDESKSFKLPSGWYVKRSTRMSGRSIGKVDKYYCERATGQVLRSLTDVQRYLADKWLEKNTTSSELLKPAGLIQMSRAEEKEDNGDMAIAPHSNDKDSYSDISDDVLLKNLVRKYDDRPLKVLVRNANDAPLKDCSRKLSDDVRVPIKDLIPKTNEAPLNDLEGKSVDDSLRNVVRKSNDVPLKDRVRKSKVARKDRKLANRVPSPKNAFSCTANTSPVDISNPPMKITWVLLGPGGADWSPFTGDTMVPESLKQQWAQMLKAIVDQNNHDASTFNALD